MPVVISMVGLYIFGAFHWILIVAGLLLQGGYLLWRAQEMGRLPLVGLHDTLLFTAFCTALSGIVLSFRLSYFRRIFLAGISVMAAVFTALGAVSPRSEGILPPILQTIWFELHVITAFVSYGLFGAAAWLAAIYLRPPMAVFPQEPPEEVSLSTKVAANGGCSEGAAERKKLFHLQYKTVLLGYLLFSLSMIAGGVWAHLAWGSYWIWTPKELWTAILWLTFTFCLHLRLDPRPFLRKVSPSRQKVLLSVMSLVGYGIVLFTYLGVGLLMKSSHSF